MLKLLNLKEQQRGVSFGTINLDYTYVYRLVYPSLVCSCIFYLKSEMRNKWKEIGEMVRIKKAQDFFTDSDEIHQTYSFVRRSIHKIKF